MGLSEKTFLNPKKMTASKEIRDEKGPSLDDFDKEIEIYQVSLSCINPTEPLDVLWTGFLKRWNTSKKRELVHNHPKELNLRLTCQCFMKGRCHKAHEAIDTARIGKR